MEKFIERENVLLGYSARRSSENSDELDFNDVFGGPPRRLSTQEVKGRHSFSESVESEEKPVFGSEVVTRRRYLGDGFFNDIFGGDESYGSPRSRDRDNPFGSNPDSRISSPARPLTPKAEVFGMSLPVQLSLPAKSAKATENPTFVPGYHRHHKMDGINNGISSPRSSNSTLSRFSSRATSGLDEMGNDVHHSISLSGEVPFTNEDLTHGGVSDEVPFTDEDLTNGGMSDKKDVGKKKKGSKSMETPNNLFHFSIYKWAGREFPMVIPLRGGKFSKLKEMNRVGRSASSNRRMESMEQESSTLEDHEILTNIEVNVVSVKPEESQKPEVKPPPSNIDEFDQQEVKGNSTKIEKGINPNVKRDEGIMDLNRKDTSKISMQTPIIHSEKRSRVKGKVKEFVKIFNQEPSSRTKVDTETPSQSCRWKPANINQPEIEVNLNAAKLDENVPVNKKPDISHSVEKNLSSNEAKHHSFRKSRSARFSTDRKNAIPSESLTKDSMASVENMDDHFEVNFVVQELSHDDNEVTLNQTSEDNRASDSKIQQWSLGKKGNIRSLLSTLQYVLWPGSGWKPVPLVDLIEANSVKRSYQKALLCLHPDKLQQKGAASHQKYIAEKVFDILQEAWDHFNTIGV